MNKKTLFWILFWIVGALVVIAGFLYFIFYPAGKNTEVKENVADNPKDATYIIEGQPVTLVNGTSVVPVAPGSATQVTTQYFGNEAVGDVNEDGVADTAFILTQNSGGSGTFYYAVVALSNSGGYVGTKGVFLGDRIAPQTTEMKEGLVIVNYADRKAGEAMSVTPSVGVSKYLGMVGTRLTEMPNPSDTAITYRNADYGFTFSLPTSWQGYSVVKSAWEGVSPANATATTGPKLLIRNPKWTSAVHYEDMPILVFTISQWNSYLAEKFSVSAAPIQASELSRNSKYVFALPPRWDFDYSLGYKEAENIIAGSPLHAF